LISLFWLITNGVLFSDPETPPSEILFFSIGLFALLVIAAVFCLYRYAARNLQDYFNKKRHAEIIRGTSQRTTLQVVSTSDTNATTFPETDQQGDTIGEGLSRFGSTDMSIVDGNVSLRRINSPSGSIINPDTMRRAKTLKNKLGDQNE
jgi:hypothetical protein